MAKQQYNLTQTDIIGLLSKNKGKRVVFSNRQSSYSSYSIPESIVSGVTDIFEEVLDKMGLTSFAVIIDDCAEVHIGKEFADKNTLIIGEYAHIFLTGNNSNNRLYIPRLSGYLYGFGAPNHIDSQSNSKILQIKVTAINQNDIELMKTYGFSDNLFEFENFYGLTFPKNSLCVLPFSIASLCKVQNVRKRQAKVFLKEMIARMLFAYCQKMKIDVKETSFYDEYAELEYVSETEAAKTFSELMAKSISERKFRISDELKTTQSQIEKTIRVYRALHTKSLYLAKELAMINAEFSEAEREKMIYDEILALKKSYDGVKFGDDPPTVSFLVRDVIVQGVPLGDFRVTLQIKNNSITIQPASDSSSKYQNVYVDSYCHPHISAGYIPCYGNMSKAMLSLLALLRLKELADVCKTFLLSYNSGGAYRQLSEFAKKVGLSRKEINSIKTENPGVFTFDLEEDEATPMDITDVVSREEGLIQPSRYAMDSVDNAELTSVSNLSDNQPNAPAF